RDLAVELGGELRSNPGFTLGRKAVSVHSQGGCGMGAPGEAVTAPDGQVHGFPGLYVVDAAAFPASVGVNPSATILAVAERKAQRFVDALQGQLAEAQRPLPIARDPRPADTARRSVPLRIVRTADVRSRPIGLTWKERMEGAFSALEVPPLSGPIDVTAFERVERRGGELGARIVANLGVVIEDIDLFLRSFRARVGRPDGVEARISGEVSVEFSRGALHRSRKYRVNAEQSRLEFVQGDAHAEAPAGGNGAAPVPKPQSPDAERGTDLIGLRYTLLLEPQNGDALGNLLLEGRKEFHDDPGHDVWPDVTTLFFNLKGCSSRPRSGVLRVGLRDFLEIQLPSMDAFMQGEPIRDPRVPGAQDGWPEAAHYMPAESARLWALVRFFGAMSLGIKDVYARWF
ncbi:MAG TPA: GMC family oxidoreductase, partial [Polyangiaceae bacterium]|nr:GMC family oxidoreductase [Polyangiaceae bacterium]